jgi:hypothetical protein
MRSLTRRSLAFLGVLVPTTLLWLVLPYVWLPKGTSTISLWWAAETFQQCSRDAPKPEGPYWLPTATEIMQLESELWPMLELREKRGESVPPRFQQFQRQYIGFTRNGERLIYGNFAVEYDDRPWRRWTLLERPVVACDGGHYFWGVVYKPRSNEFEEPQFNGNA